MRFRTVDSDEPTPVLVTPEEFGKLTDKEVEAKHNELWDEKDKIDAALQTTSREIETRRYNAIQHKRDEEKAARVQEETKDRVKGEESWDACLAETRKLLDEEHPRLDAILANMIGLGAGTKDREVARTIWNLLDKMYERGDMPDIVVRVAKRQTRDGTTDLPEAKKVLAKIADIVKALNETGAL